MLIRAFFDARREDGGRVRLPMKSFSPLLMVANGREFDDKEEERCINVKEASVSSFPKLTPSRERMLDAAVLAPMTLDSKTFCFDGMMSLVDSRAKRGQLMLV